MNPYDSRHRRRAPGGYPMSTVLEARKLGEAGFGPMEIVRVFSKQGIEPLPTPGAVKWWLKRALDYEAHMESQRRNKARKNASKSGGRLLTKPRSPEFKVLRIQALADRRVSATTIATLMEFDFGEPLTEAQVRYAIRTGRYPKVRRAA